MAPISSASVTPLENTNGSSMQTEAAAKEAAKLAPVAHKAQELGLTVDEITNTANANRTSIKTAIESYLHERRFGRPRSIKAYENVFDQLLANLPQGVRFVDQLADSGAS